MNIKGPQVIISTLYRISFSEMLCIPVNIFSNVWIISCLPELNQYVSANKMPCSRTQHSDINNATGQLRSASFFILANNENPGEMPPYAVFDQCLHCLQ